jgi:methylmalonyl-CoA mutase cobalamin-binding subunit
MTDRRVVVGSTATDDGAADRVAAEARRRRDAGQEVVLLGHGLDVEHLARAAVAEDATEVVVLGSADDADVLTAWLAEHAFPGGSVRHAPV